MDIGKDIIDALRLRALSPIYGNFILFAFAINWKAFVFLIFGSADLFDKFVYFDLVTGHFPYTTFQVSPFVNLIILPGLLTVLVVFSSPYLRDWFHFLAEKPNERRTIRILNAEHNKKIELLKHAKTQKDEENALQQSEEQKILLEGQNDDKATEISDPEAREKTQFKLRKFREKFSKDQKDLGQLASEIGSTMCELIRAAGNSDGIITIYDSGEDYIVRGGDYETPWLKGMKPMLERWLNTLEKKGMIQLIRENSYKLTQDGYELSDFIAQVFYPPKHIVS